MKKLMTLSTFVLAASIANSQAPPSTSTTSSVSFAKSVGLYVFPAKNQTAEVQSKDDAECYKWAVQESGYDPLNPTKVDTAKVNTGPSGQAVRGAARGAAAGVAIGAIAGDAGKGAAIGAATGAMAGRRAKVVGDAQQQEKNVQAADQKHQEMVNSFKKAFTVCLEGKGYTVK